MIASVSGRVSFLAVTPPPVRRPHSRAGPLKSGWPTYTELSGKRNEKENSQLSSGKVRADMGGVGGRGGYDKNSLPETQRIDKILTQKRNIKKLKPLGKRL